MATALPFAVQSADEIVHLIRAAIIGKTSLWAIYDGGLRLLCPHILGRNRAGYRPILCLQIGGESARGLERKNGPGDWRCLSLEKFSSVEQTEALWQNVGSSLRRSSCIDRMEWEVTG